MTSTFERENDVPLRVAFDDESSQSVKKKKKSKTLKEEGSHHKWGFDVEERKHGKEEKEHKKKKDKIKSKKTKDTLKAESQVTPIKLEYEMPSPAIVQSEKDIGDKPSEKTNKPKVIDKDSAASVSITPEDSKDAPQLKKSENKPTKEASNEKMESGEDVRGDDKAVIRAATRRDFCDFGTDNSCRGFRDGKGSNFSIASNRKSHRKDACTATTDSSPGPCRLLGRPKRESCVDLCEKRKGGELGADCCKWDRWCDEAKPKRDAGRETWRNYNGKGAAGLVHAVFDSYEESPMGNRYDGTGRTKRTETDEMAQLKNDMMNLQSELDRLKDCFRVAANIAGEKNKCKITKMKEHIRCNFANCMPDFAKLREKLKSCHLMNMKLCREFRMCSDRDHWRTDFESLMTELNTIKVELEKIRKDKN